MVNEEEEIFKNDYVMLTSQADLFLGDKMSENHLISIKHG